MTKKRILIVDDELNIRRLLAQTLASDDVDLESAVNGEEALEKLAAAGYDLMLLDMRLPGMDGMEVLRRTREQSPRLPIVLLTAHGTVETAVEAMRSGAIDYLQKPFSPDELRRAVARALEAGWSGER